MTADSMDRQFWGKMTAYGLNILRDNNLLKEIFLQQYDNKKCTKWITQIKKYMEILQINIHMIETYSVMTIKNMIKIMILSSGMRFTKQEHFEII